jgi:uncharacterized protein YaaQ
VKMIAAMIQDQDAYELSGALVEKGYRATKVQTTGAFLQRNNVAVFIGVEDEEVESALEIIREHCKTRRTKVYPSEAPHLLEPMEVEIGGAVIFVWEVERFERL